MKTPNEYKKNLENGICTKTMLFDCMFSAKERKENHKRLLRRPGFDFRGTSESQLKTFEEQLAKLWMALVKVDKCDEYREYRMVKPYHGDKKELVSPQFITDVIDLIYSDDCEFVDDAIPFAKWEAESNPFAETPKESEEE